MTDIEERVYELYRRTVQHSRENVSPDELPDLLIKLAILASWLLGAELAETLLGDTFEERENVKSRSAFYHHIIEEGVRRQRAKGARVEIAYEILSARFGELDAGMIELLQNADILFASQSAMNIFVHHAISDSLDEIRQSLQRLSMWGQRGRLLMGDMDQGIKRLLQTHPQDMLTIVLPDAEYLGPIATDIAAEPQLITDTLFRIQRHGQVCGVDFEAEAYPSSEMARRCYEYGSRARIVHGLPIYSVVLWLLQRGNVPQPPYVLRVGPDVIATWNFVNVELYKLQGKPIVDGHILGLIPLVSFMADRSESLVERATYTIKESGLPRSEEEELVSLLALFTSITFQSKDLARAIIGRVYMSTDILDMSPLWQEATNQGALRTKREDVRLLLEKRFGTLAPDLITAIDHADIDTLKGIFLEAVTEPLDAIRARLLPPTTDTTNQP
jgi:hypothetical protein